MTIDYPISKLFKDLAEFHNVPIKRVKKMFLAFFTGNDYALKPIGIALAPFLEEHPNADRTLIYCEILRQSRNALTERIKPIEESPTDKMIKELDKWTANDLWERVKDMPTMQEKFKTMGYPDIVGTLQPRNEIKLPEKYEERCQGATITGLQFNEIIDCMAQIINRVKL